MGRTACIAPAHSGRSMSTTSKPDAASARSTASSMVGSASPMRRSRPTTLGGVAGWKPGSSKRIPSTTAATSAAMGPIVSRLSASKNTPSNGTRPHVVFRPTVPQHAEGIRTDPPVSLP